jgi:(p)ppGpp synthase/HD superfamily hydrolase
VLYFKMNKTSKLLEAIRYATEKHAGQTRSATTRKDLPYMLHPLEAAMILAECGWQNERDLLIGAVLHDVLEDTDGTEEEIKLKFGNVVLDLVKSNTDDPSLDKIAQKRLQVTSMANKSRLSQLIKIADKTANMRDIVRIKPDWKTSSKKAYIENAREVVRASHWYNSEGNPASRKLLEAFAAAADAAMEATLEEEFRSNNGK